MDDRNVYEPTSSASTSDPGDISSASAAYISATEEQPSSSALSAAYISTVEEEQTVDHNWTWTSVNSDEEDEDDGGGYVQVLPGREVHKYEGHEITFLHKIGEGGQGTIYTAVTKSANTSELFQQSLVSSEPVEYKVVPRDEYKVSNHPCVAKLFKGKKYGQWPEKVFNLHLSSQFICQFKGYCIDGDSFYLLMKQYDGSLRDLLANLLGKKKNRPLDDITVLSLIIQIALGMQFLHDNNIIHRDLKADNIFITVDPTSFHVFAYIGDFDVASYVVGTLFWRAPEILQALKEETRPVFTPKADVYSFAMTCYEILTGAIPLVSEGVRYSDYDAVIFGERRPKLPDSLHPKMKQFLTRCWHQDPEARPTFNEIVVELRALHRELITGSRYSSKVFDSIFELSQSSLDIVGADPKICLKELKEVLQAVLLKYNEPEFLVFGLEIVTDVDQYVTQYGLPLRNENPTVQFEEWLPREIMRESIDWKIKVFERLYAYIMELPRIMRLFQRVLEGINNDHRAQEVSFAEMEVAFEGLKVGSDLFKTIEATFAKQDAWIAGMKSRVLPDQPHKACMESDELPCDLCNHVHLGFTDRDEHNFKSHLYVDNGFSLAEMTSWMLSSFKAMIRVVD